MTNTLRLTGAFILLAYAAIAAGDSGIFSVCVGPDGHLHVESLPCGDQCEEEQPAPDTDSCTDCVDFPVVCKAVIAPSGNGTSHSSGPLAFVAAAHSTAFSALQLPLQRCASGAPPFADAGPTALRSTVLLI